MGSYLAEENALRLLNLRRAARSVEGAGPGPEGNVTKLKLADHMVEGAAIIGGAGWARRRAARRARRAGRPTGDGRPGMAIAGGTSEVTRNQIAERILGMPRDPLIN